MKAQDYFPHRGDRSFAVAHYDLALSYDEELGCLGVPSLIDLLARAPVRPLLCLVGEPTGMQVATGHKGKVALRVDRFKAREDDLVPLDPNGERGSAVALAYTRALTPSLTLVAEALSVRSTRPARALFGDAPHQHERSVTTALRWRF